MGDLDVTRYAGRNTPGILGVAEIIDQRLECRSVLLIIPVKMFGVFGQVDRAGPSSAGLLGTGIVGVGVFLAIIHDRTDGLQIIGIDGIFTAETAKDHIRAAVITDRDRKMGDLLKRKLCSVRRILDRAGTAFKVAIRIFGCVISDFLEERKLAG